MLLIVLGLLLCIAPVHATVAIVSTVSGGSTAEDSLTVAFVVTDSIGNISAADSMYVTVFDPNGDSIYSAAYTVGDSEVDVIDLTGRTVYRWTEAVADIAGTARPGAYSGILVVVDTLDGAGADYLDGAATFSFILDPSLAARAAIGDTIQRSASELTAADRVGINLDNTSGTLDATELGTGAVNNVTLADGAISSSKIQDYALTSYKLAGNIITAGKLAPDALDAVWEYDTTLIADGIGAMLKDTGVYQGAGASLDSSTLAGWVWNTPAVNHATGGTFGGNLDAAISGLGTGSGTYPYTFFTIDEASQQPIPYTGIAVRSVDMAALVAVGRTDASGALVCQLDADSFVVLANASGYTFADLDTVVVEATGSHIVQGEAFDPGDPGQPDLCRVFGHVYRVDGAPLIGATVAAALPKGVVRSGERVIAPMLVTTTTDSTGAFQVDLVPSARLIPDNTRYELTIVSDGATLLRRRLLIPDQTSWRLDW
ncbi:hypothetical protein GF420_07870 [candidate division GN15 bacterium]|nr:hypothetical protein [candidate division GN15 bacterium]